MESHHHSRQRENYFKRNGNSTINWNVMGSSHHLHKRTWLKKSAYHSDKRKFCLSFKCRSAALLGHKTAKSSKSLKKKPCCIRKVLASTIFRVHTCLPDSTIRLWAHAVNTQDSGRFLQGLTKSQELVHVQAEHGAAGDTALVRWSPIQ